MNEMNVLTLNGTQYEIADKKARQNMASAVAVTMTGTAVSTDMVSPLGHEVECRVESGNLLKLVPTDNEETKGTITRSVSGGIVTLSGTESDSQISFVIPTKSGLVGGCFFSSFKKEEVPSGVKTQFVIGNEYKNDIGLGREITTNDEVRQVVIVIPPHVNPNGIVFKFMINKGTSPAPYTPYIPDLSAVRVSRYGKNLAVFEQGGLDVNGNNLPVSDPTNKARIRIANLIPIHPNKTVVFSGGISRAPGLLDRCLYDESGKFIGKFESDNIGDGAYAYKNATSNLQYIRFCLANLGAPINPSMVPNAQLEYGKAKTEFEPVRKEAFTPSPSGEATGMKSISPSMTILTDNPAATITATYNADTKRYIDSKFTELQSAILSQGGNV